MVLLAHFLLATYLSTFFSQSKFREKGGRRKRRPRVKNKLPPSPPPTNSYHTTLGEKLTFTFLLNHAQQQQQQQQQQHTHEEKGQAGEKGRESRRRREIRRRRNGNGVLSHRRVRSYKSTFACLKRKKWSMRSWFTTGTKADTRPWCREGLTCWNLLRARLSRINLR